jgi:hypothetical protein
LETNGAVQGSSITHGSHLDFLESELALEGPELNIVAAFYEHCGGDGSLFWISTRCPSVGMDRIATSGAEQSDKEVRIPKPYQEEQN